MLDKETWKKRVLPAMAKQLGLEVWQNSGYYQNPQSAISLEDWNSILAYYDSLAPVRLSAAKAPATLLKDWSVFDLLKPKTSPSIATTTLATIEPGSGNIFTSDSETGKLYQWDKNLHLSRSSQLPSPAVHIEFDANKNAIITAIGEMKAIDVPSGAILMGRKDKDDTTPIATNLIRPVHTVSADFDKDGMIDYVVSSFGHNKGGLYLARQKGNNQFETRPIREIAGATQSIAIDFNNDGWTDIVTLFAHGDEGIWLFLNDKKGGFETKNLLRFPPVYGSSSFQLTDINKDGKPDIIYTSGDNSDYSRILKPYHGVYIFTNDGDQNFKQRYFYPVNGATKVMAADFDLDGDIDLVSIAFFADLKNNPQEGVIYFENKNSLDKSSLQFAPHAIPVNKEGRWITMDVKDADGDGDPDVVLGNYSKGFLNERNFEPDWNINTPFVLLRNKIK
ncbi:MAG TPA: VCBS repeat-containing protein [Dyadobacter sp.]|nr:VCBS repeat-containing protein [Dyadobacter sp.]